VLILALQCNARTVSLAVSITTLNFIIVYLICCGIIVIVLLSLFTAVDPRGLMQIHIMQSDFRDNNLCNIPVLKFVT